MTADQARTMAMRLLAKIAPEADLGRLDENASLREQLDIDSMDFLNWVVALAKEMGLQIPESDYPHLATLRQGSEYLARRSIEPPESTSYKQ